MANPHSEYSELKTILFEIVFISSILIFGGVLTFVVTRNTGAYASGLGVKQYRADTAPSPRLILSGGSGLAFGFDSEFAKSELHVEPINFGLYAGSGLRFMLAQAAEAAHASDTIVLIPEYEVLENDPEGNGFMLLELVQADPRTIRFIQSPPSITRMFSSLPWWMQTRIFSFVGREFVRKAFPEAPSMYHRVYRAQNFNAYGDMVGHLNESYRVPSSTIAEAKQNFISGNVHEKNLLLLKEFREMQEKNGVVVLFSWPPIPQTVYDANRSQIAAFQTALVESFGADNILGRPEDFVFPDSDFFDTVNHLDANGRRLRTAKLLTFLQGDLSSEPE